VGVGRATPPDDTGPPAASTLAELPPDLWATLIPAARAALHAVDEAELTPRMRQLRATPTGRLAGGRARHDLCRVLAEDATVWRATVEALAQTRRGSELLELLVTGEAPRREPPDAGHQLPEPARGGRDRRERESRLRARNRELLGQRDTAARRAEGLEARLGVERQRIGELEGEIARLRASCEELRDRLAAAREDHARTLDRQRRQHESEVAELRDELRSYRRREEERRRRGRRERAAPDQVRQPDTRATAPAREDGDGDGGAPEPRRAQPGRPSRLPPGVAPDTTEAASALLGPGRLVLIDGYNVTKQRHEALSLEQQRLWLRRLVAGLAARRKIQPTIVFDGRSGAEAPSRPQRWVRVVFSSGRSADDVIVETIERLPADEPVAVVTDDRELRRRVERLRADVIPTRNFLGVAG
jgi:hypothetical protein